MEQLLDIGMVKDKYRLITSVYNSVNSGLSLKEPEFSYLENENVDNELYKKYDYYYNVGFRPVQDSLINMWSYLINVLNSQEFADTGVPLTKTDAASTNKNIAMGRVKSSFMKFNRYFRKNKNSVEVKINIPNIDFYVGFGIVNDQEEKLKRAENTVKAVLPDFKLPTSWTFEQGGQETFNRKFPRPNVGDIQNKEPILLEEFKLIDISFTPREGSNNPTNFKFAPHYREHFANQVYLNFEIREKDTRVESLDLDKSSGGPIQNINGLVKFSLVINAYLRFPMEYALWATNVSDENNFIEKNFYDLFSGLWSSSYDTDTKKYNVKRISSLDKVKKKNEKKKELFIPKKRTNSRDLAILKSGHPAWIPEVDNTGKHKSMLKSAYDTSENRIKKLSELNVTVKNMPLYADWFNNKFAFVNSDGNINITDLSGCIALDSVTIHNLLEIDLFSNSRREMFNSEALFYAIDTELSKYSDFNELDKKTGYKNIKQVYERLRTIKNSNNLSLTLSHVAGKPFEESDNDKVKKEVRLLLDELKNAANEVYKYFNKSTLPFSFKKDSLKPGLDIVVYYGSNYKKYQEIYRQKIEDNKTTSTEEFLVESKDESFDIPNSPGIEKFGLMPHQAASNKNLQKHPENSVIDIDAGGGKSVLIYTDIIELLKNDKIKRPLVIMPGGLNPQFFNEIVNNYSNGEMNVFPITLETVRKMKEKLKWNEKDMISYMKNMPKNTIFITNYDFTKNKREIDTDKQASDIIYGNQVIEQFPNVEFLRAVEFDYVASDESQWIKKKDAKRSQSTINITADSKFGRNSSGTVIQDSPLDLVGQMAQLNPAILVNEENFKMLYGENKSSKSETLRVSSWNSSMGQDIKEKIAPYSMYLSRGRSEWGFLLPMVRENFFQVPGLTDDQREFYEKLMEQALDEIKNNPKLKKMIEEGNPEDEEKIEQALKRSLFKVEIFANAPDENEAFIGTEPEESDKISPKMKLIDKIIDAHFYGGTIDSVTYKEDSNKIIVFCYNKAVSRHIFRHTKHKMRSLHYVAGAESVLDKFLDKDSGYDVLIADEASIKEGRNFQIASHVIRVQTLWSPGDQEQAISRILRPDVRGEFDRKEIRFSWVVLKNTIEIAKTARLFSKIISKTRIEEENNPRFPKEKFENDLPLIKMNFDNITSINDFNSLEMQKYFKAYSDLINWQNDEYKKGKENLKNHIEKKLGRKVESDKELKKLAMYPVSGKDKLPGSRKVYTPWIEGTRANIDIDVDIVPIESKENLEDEGEDKDENYQKNARVSIDQKVFTEFGIGKIKKELKHDVYVEVNGFGSIKLNKTLVYVPTSNEERVKLNRIARNAGPNGYTLIQPKDKSKTENSDPPSEPEDELKTSPEKENNKLFLETSIINELPALWARYDNKDIQDKVLARGTWYYVPEFMYAKIKTRNAMDYFIGSAENYMLDINPQRKELLAEIRDKVQSRGGQLYRTKPVQFSNKMRNFIKLQHRRVGEDNSIRPYPVIWDDEVFVAINRKTHKSKALEKMARIPSRGGFERFVYHQGIVVFFFDKQSIVKREIERLNRDIGIQNYEEILEKVEKIQIV